MSCVDCVFSKPCFPKGVDMMREKAGIIPSQFGRQLRSKNSEDKLTGTLMNSALSGVRRDADSEQIDYFKGSNKFKYGILFDNFLFFSIFFREKKRKKVAFL